MRSRCISGMLSSAGSRLPSGPLKGQPAFARHRIAIDAVREPADYPVLLADVGGGARTGVAAAVVHDAAAQGRQLRTGRGR